MTIKPGKYDPLKPDIELFDYKSKKRYGLRLEGQGALQVGTVAQDDSVQIRNAGKRVGDFDEQRSWKGGRGIELLSENAEAFWDSMNMWTLSDNHMHQTLLWRFARGLRSCDFFMPDPTHPVAWKQLLGTSLYVSMSWSSSGFTSDYARLWIRRVGTPGTLTFKLHSDNAGVPGTVLQTVTKTVTDITDYISVLQLFDFTGTQALTASTTYHISIFGASTDNKNNHWEVGGYNTGATGKISTDGSSWSAASFDLYYYVADADIKRQWFSFFLDGAMYLVDKKDDLTTASKVYINGDRGKATSVTSTTITDTARSWTTNRWAGAFVRVVRGTGAGQTQQILSNTATALTTNAFDFTLDTTSEYIIYGTEWFTEVATSGLGVVRSQPILANQIVYFPQGSATNVRRLIWSGTAHVWSDDGTNKYSFMIVTIDPTDIRVWGLLNNSSSSGGAKTIAFATASAWANPPAALVFSTAKKVGDATYNITGVVEKDKSVYIFKEDGTWIADFNNNLTKLNSGSEKVPSSVTGIASIAHQQFVYYSWLHSLIRIYGATFDDIGQDWSGYGLPDGREGYFSSLDSYTSLLIAAVNAGTGTSSVLGWDGVGWHELLRAYDANKPIRLVKVQPCPETRNRTWTDIGGDLVYQEMPFQKGTPRLDSGVAYMHEGVVESATIDMGTASGLAKFIKELTVTVDNLGNGNEIYVDFQVDDDVHTSNWTNATVLYQSPESVSFLGLNNVRKFAYRLRILARRNDVPVDVRGVTPNGYARSPYKMVWTLRCRADNITSRGRMVKPDELMRWLLDNARFPGRLEMRSQYELAHKFFVIVHPPRMFPYKPAQNGQAEESMFTIVLEEA